MLIDGIVINCSDKNNVKVKLRNGNEVNAKGESFTVQNNQRVWLLTNQVFSGVRAGFLTTKVSSYSIISVQSSFEDSFTPTTYSV